MNPADPEHPSAPLSRRARWLARQLTPLGVLEARRVVQATRRFGGLPRHPVLASRALRSSRLDIVPPRVDLLGGPIVDLGANRGDWSAAVLLLVPRARIIAIEPTPDLAKALRTRFDAQAVTVIEKAVSDEAGAAVLHLTDHSHNSSLRKPRNMNHVYVLGWQERGTIDVETTTLDLVLAGEQASLVKIDVQGAEAAVLRGGHDALARAQAVLLEVTTTSHYEEDTLFPDLHESMVELGFQLAGLSQPFIGADQTALWFDACYVNQRQPFRGAAAPADDWT